MKTKRWWLEKILLFFFFFFFHAKQKLETEVLPSRIERSRSSAKQKLGQDLPQREGESGTGRKAARNRPNSSHSRFPPLPAFPPFVAARNDDEQCANAEGFPRKRLFALSEGKYEYHRFVRTLTLLPREPFRFTCPPPLLPRLFSSLSERARPVGVGNDKCLPQVSGKHRRHDKCIAFRRSSLSLDEKQPVSLESANPTLRASKLSSTVKFELIDTFCGYLLPDSKGGGGIILFIVGTILLLFARRSNRIDGKLIIM